MRILVLYCHPSEESLNGRVFKAVVQELQNGDHDVRSIDLYSDDFEPVMSRDEWDRYFNDPVSMRKQVQHYLDDLQWADRLVLIFPTWMYGPPAKLKGWLEKVFLPGVTFDIAPTRFAKTVPLLTNIKGLYVVTTSGSPWWLVRLLLDPVRRALTGTAKNSFGIFCKIKWLQLYGMNHVTEEQRDEFVARAVTMVRKIG